MAFLSILSCEISKGLKCLANLLKSLNGFSEIRRDFPSGQVTLLLIKITDALEERAFL